MSIVKFDFKFPKQYCFDLNRIPPVATKVDCESFKLKDSQAEFKLNPKNNCYDVILNGKKNSVSRTLPQEATKTIKDLLGKPHRCFLEYRSDGQVDLLISAKELREPTICFHVAKDEWAKDIVKEQSEAMTFEIFKAPYIDDQNWEFRESSIGWQASLIGKEDRTDFVQPHWLERPKPARIRITHKPTMV